MMLWNNLLFYATFLNICRKLLCYETKHFLYVFGDLLYFVNSQFVGINIFQIEVTNWKYVMTVNKTNM